MASREARLTRHTQWTLLLLIMDETITLKQGLEQFYKNYDSQLSHTQKNIPIEVRSFFKSHDIVHVLFGCDINLYGEGSVKIWTIFGTTLGFWNHIKLYRKSNAYELAKNFSSKHIALNLCTFLLRIPSLIIRAKRMKKLWPWSDFEAYLDRPLSEIRKEFNIILVS